MPPPLETLTSTVMTSVLAAIRAQCVGSVTVSPAAIEEASRDFGGIVRRRPQAVFLPANAADVTAVLQIATQYSVPVVARGSGHSQAGQCLGEGIVVDMRGFDRVLRVDTDAGLIEVEGGARWRSIVDAAFEVRHLPIGLTHVLDTTIGGTLSVAGIGAEAWRVGAQVDNVEFLDVATLEEGIVRCSRVERSELFDAVRSGLGQCGIITRAGYPIRPCRERVRSRYFKFTKVDRFMNAAGRVCAATWASFVSGAITRDHDGSWVLLLIVGLEYGPDAPEEEPVKDLDFDEELPQQDAPLWDASGIPGHLFFRLHAPTPGSLDADPGTRHPWVEHVFSREGAEAVLGGLMRRQSPFATLGTNALGFLKPSSVRAPLFALPPSSEVLWAIGVFANASPTAAEGVTAMMGAYSEWGRTTGGKRYLSGFVEFADESAWADHYGDAWPNFVSAKRRFDPARILNPSFISWPA